MNRDAFETYVETQLDTTTLKPGDVVILDNLAAHRSSLADRLLAERGGVWFLFYRLIRPT